MYININESFGNLPNLNSSRTNLPNIASVEEIRQPT